MQFISHAKAAVLDTILDSNEVKIASPFLSKNTVSRISTNRHKRFELITRLPRTYHSPVAFIENDPLPLFEAAERMGAKFKLYALPTVHSKIYLNEQNSWTGSANFTDNGFSGKPELLIDFGEKSPDLDAIFKTYVNQSRIVTKKDLRTLLTWLDAGLTEVALRGGNAIATADEPEASGASYEDFVGWLGKYKGPHQADAVVLLNRAKGGNQMSGHVASAFNGVTSFLRKNPALRQAVKKYSNTSFGQEITAPLSAFIKKHGDSYRGPNGGKWRNYLSTRLGGRQTTGGAGNTIVKRTLILLPSYLDHRNL